LSIDCGNIDCGNIDCGNSDGSQLAKVLQRRIYRSAIERSFGFDFPVLYSLFDLPT
jgi:hypothetical protein